PKEYPYIILKYDREMLDKSDLFYKVFEEEKYVFCDYYSQILKYQSEVTVDFGWKMIAISFVAILFAVILFANFIAVSIQDKIKQIGILRAIGATKNQISTIFVVQNSIIALFVFIFSSTVINYTIMPLLLLMGTSSKPFPFPLYELQVSDYLFLFVIIIVTSIIASLFPLLRLSRKTPRELMIK
ncbi:MAG: FtsX-like permease family protein, partial [Clostridia bacterium]|nr:FtsX-like permease family protein [Clostridia bacterium]